MDDNLFTTYNMDGVRVQTFGVLLPDQRNTGILLDGFLEPIVDSALVYASHNATILAGYGLKGDRLYFMQTIDGFHLPIITRTKRGASVNIRIDEGESTSASELSIVQDRLFIFVRDPKKTASGSVLDVYNISNGQYEYSIPLAGHPRKAVATEHYVFTLEGLQISRWNRSKPKHF